MHTDVTAASADTPRKRRPYAPRMPAEQRRVELREAALRIIARDGYGAATAGAIAAEAGVTKPVLYNVYPKLSELFAELLDLCQAEAQSQLLAAMAAGGRPTAGSITHAWLAAVRSRPMVWAPILLMDEVTPEEVRLRYREGRDVIVTSLASLMGGGDGSVRPRLAAETFVAAAEWFGRRVLQDPTPHDDAELAALFDDLARAVVIRPRQG